MIQTNVVCLFLSFNGIKYNLLLCGSLQLVLIPQEMALYLKSNSVVINHIENIIYRYIVQLELNGNIKTEGEVVIKRILYLTA